MQGLDSNLYFKQRGIADVVGSAKQGFTLGQMIKKNRLADRERENQQKLKSMIADNISYDDKGNMSASGETIGQLARLDPNTANKYASQLSGQATKQSQAETAASRYADTRSDRAADVAFRDKKLDQETAFKKAKAAFDAKKAEKSGENNSEFQKTLDREGAKNLSDYQVGGGKNVVDTNIKRFENALQTLGEKGELTGGVTGYLGETVQDAFNSDMSAVRDDIRSAIQGSLKPILGGQFTEKEAEAIFSRAFNPRLSDKENIRRATLELNNIKSIAANKEAAMDYFNQHKTLSGFKPAAIQNTNVAKTPNNLNNIDPSMVAQKNPNQGIIQNANASAMPPEIIVQKKSRMEELRKKRAMSQATGKTGGW